MCSNHEALLTSERSGQLWNCCAWDFATGTSLCSIKGGRVGVSAPRTLSVIGEEFLISAEPGKSIINIWSFQRKDSPYLRIVTPGNVGALAVTPCGAYCIASVAHNVHIWQVSTGDLLTVISHHHQPITCLRTTDDGAFFLSSGEDNLVLVFKLLSVLHSVRNTATSQDNAPIYTWPHNSLPVTDVFVGKGSRRARVATVSLDHTVRLYTLRNGQLLMTVIMEVSLMSVVMDAAEFSIFAGGSDGRIYEICLLDPPQTSKYHFSSSRDKEKLFIGHSKAVTCLALSMDGETLISGSDDQEVKVWDAPSRQCVRSLSHKGPITNIVLIPAANLHRTNPPSISVENFKSFLCTSDPSWEYKACATIRSEWKPEFEETFQEAKKRLQQLHNGPLDAEQVLKEMLELQKFNDLLYDNTINKIMLT